MYGEPFEVTLNFLVHFRESERTNLLRTLSMYQQYDDDYKHRCRNYKKYVMIKKYGSEPLKLLIGCMHFPHCMHCFS